MILIYRRAFLQVWLKPLQDAVFPVGAEEVGLLLEECTDGLACQEFHVLLEEKDQTGSQPEYKGPKDSCWAFYRAL